MNNQAHYYSSKCTFKKFSVTFPVLLTVFFNNSAKAQQVHNQGRIYSVAAYENGDNSVISQSNLTKVANQKLLKLTGTFTQNNDELIIQTKNANKQLNGTFNGIKLPVSMYLYQISAIRVNEEAIPENKNLI